MEQLVASALLLSGTFFMFVASLGIVRMPDVYLRMSCTSKAATLGAGCLLGAVAVAAEHAGVAGRALATILFLLLTAPVAAHLLGRAAYRLGVPLWSGSCCDELRGAYSEGGVLQGRTAPRSHTSPSSPMSQHGI